MEELKLVPKWGNILDEGEDSNTKENDEPNQTNKKSWGRPPKKVNVQSSKPRTSLKN